MNLRRVLAASMYGFIGLAMIAVGFVYLSASRFMPYHAVALDSAWEDLDVRAQTLTLGLMHVAGGGWAAFGVLTLALVAFPFRRGERWARLCLPCAALIAGAANFAATWSVHVATGAASPWRASLAMIIVAALAFLIDAPWSKGRVRTAPRGP